MVDRRLGIITSDDDSRDNGEIPQKEDSSSDITDPTCDLRDRQADWRDLFSRERDYAIPRK